MLAYYVNRNAQSNGDHEVHEETCAFVPAPENRIYLGTFTHCRDAGAAVRQHFAHIDGCYYCSPACHAQ